MTWFKGFPAYHIRVVPILDKRETVNAIDGNGFLETARKYGVAVDFVQRELELRDRRDKALFITDKGHLSQWDRNWQSRVGRPLDMKVDINANYKELAAMDDVLRTGKGPNTIGIMVKLNGDDHPLRLENKTLNLFRPTGMYVAGILPART